MYKVEKIKNSLDCDVCKQLLVDPMVMSCGKFFCKSHLTQLLINHESAKKLLSAESAKKNISFQIMVSWLTIDSKN